MLINQFLVLCRMAQDSSIAHAFAYDQLLWESIKDRMDKGDKKIDLEELLSEIDPKIEAEAEKKVKKARATSDAMGSSRGSSSKEPKTTPKVKWCSICKTYGHVSEDCRNKLWCAVCGKYGNHETKACFSKKAKGSNKGNADKNKDQVKKKW